MDRSRLEQLVVQWRGEAGSSVNVHNTSFEKGLIAATRSCANELESLLKDSQVEAVRWPERMINLPCPDGTSDRIVGFRIADGDPILGKFGLSEPLTWLRQVTIDRIYDEPQLTQPSPPDAVQLEQRARQLLARELRADVRPGAAEEVEAGKLDHDPAMRAIRAALAATPADGDDGWEANFRYLLERCPHTLRSRQGGGAENLMESAVLTFTRMEHALSATPEPQRQAQGEDNFVSRWTKAIREMPMGGQPPHQDRGEEVTKLVHDLNWQVDYLMGPNTVMLRDLFKRAATMILTLAEAKQQGSGEALTVANEMEDWANLFQREDDHSGPAQINPEKLKSWASRIRTTPPQGEAKQQTPAAVPDGMLLIQKTDAECLVRDAERFIGIREGTVGGRLARKRVRALLAATPAASEGESRNG